MKKACMIFLFILFLIVPSAHAAHNRANVWNGNGDGYLGNLSVVNTTMPLYGKTQFTVMGWIKPDTWNAGNNLYAEFNNSSISLYKFLIAPGPVARLSIGASLTFDVSLPSRSNGKWAHLAFFVDLVYHMMWVALDGVPVGSIYNTNITQQTYDSTNQLTVAGKANPLPGWLDEVAVFDTILDLATVRRYASMDLNNPSPVPNLVSYWELNDAPGSTTTTDPISGVVLTETGGTGNFGINASFDTGEPIGRFRTYEGGIGSKGCVLTTPGYGENAASLPDLYTGKYLIIDDDNSIPHSDEIVTTTSPDAACNSIGNCGTGLCNSITFLDGDKEATDTRPTDYTYAQNAKIYVDPLIRIGRVTDTTAIVIADFTSTNDEDRPVTMILTEGTEGGTSVAYSMGNWVTDSDPALKSQVAFYFEGLTANTTYWTHIGGGRGIAGGTTGLLCNTSFKTLPSSGNLKWAMSGGYRYDKTPNIHYAHGNIKSETGLNFFAHNGDIVYEVVGDGGYTSWNDIIRHFRTVQNHGNYFNTFPMMDIDGDDHKVANNYCNLRGAGTWQYYKEKWTATRYFDLFWQNLLGTYEDVAAPFENPLTTPSISLTDTTNRKIVEIQTSPMGTDITMLYPPGKLVKVIHATPAAYPDYYTYVQASSFASYRQSVTLWRPDKSAAAYADIVRLEVPVRYNSHTINSRTANIQLSNDGYASCITVNADKTVAWSGNEVFYGDAQTAWFESVMDTYIADSNIKTIIVRSPKALLIPLDSACGNGFSGDGWGDAVVRSANCVFVVTPVTGSLKAEHGRYIQKLKKASNAGKLVIIESGDVHFSFVAQLSHFNIFEVGISPLGSKMFPAYRLNAGIASPTFDKTDGSAQPCSAFPCAVTTTSGHNVVIKWFERSINGDGNCGPISDGTSDGYYAVFTDITSIRKNVNMAYTTEPTDGMVQVEIKRGMADGVGPVSTVWTETFGAPQQSKVKAAIFDSQTGRMISGRGAIIK